MDTTTTKEEFLKESMIEVMLNMNLCDRFAGFEGIIIGLCEKGEVLFPKTPDIERHLNTYSWVVDKGDYDEAFGIVQFKVDYVKFVQSEQFKSELAKEISQLEKDNRAMKKEIEENEIRIAALKFD